MDRMKGAMGDVKTRTIIIFTGIIILIAVGIGLTGLKHRQSLQAGPEGESHTAKIKQQQGPGQLGIADKEYNELQRRQNKEQAQSALKEGGAAVPTIVGEQLSQLDSAVVGIDQGQQTAESADKARQDAAAEYQKKLAEEAQSAADRAAAESAAKASAATAAGESQKEAAFEALMTTQATALFKLWQPPVMAYKAGVNFTTLLPPAPPAAGTPGAPAAPGTPGAAPPEQVILKAGDIAFAILETAVNSDEPGPVMAKIVSGPLQGSKVIGQMALAGVNAEKATLNFTVLNMPSSPKSIAFSAVAIDPETSRTAMATDVDHHYLLRYGSMLGGAFLEGMGNAVTEGIKNPGLTQTSSGGAVAPAPNPVDTRQQVITGLGNMGAKIGENLNVFNRPSTITIKSGTSMGLLLLADLTLGTPAGTVPPVGSLNAGGVTSQNKIQEIKAEANAIVPSAKNNLLAYKP
jgi:intracellular multiplication protein IcmE